MGPCRQKRRHEIYRHHLETPRRLLPLGLEAHRLGRRLHALQERPAQPLAEACKKHGIRFCVYHSIMDWSPSGLGDQGAVARQRRQPEPGHGPLHHLSERPAQGTGHHYHPGILWFDGEWEAAWTHERGVDLYDILRAMDPALIINNRVDKGRAGMQGHTTDAKFKGDYGTPEQEIPATGFGPDVAWESCMTMNDTWGFKTSDTELEIRRNPGPQPHRHRQQGWQLPAQRRPHRRRRNPRRLAGTSRRHRRVDEDQRRVHPWHDRLVVSQSLVGRPLDHPPQCRWNHPSLSARFQPPRGWQTHRQGLATRPEKAAISAGRRSTIDGQPGAWTLQLPGGPLDPIATVVTLLLHGRTRNPGRRQGALIVRPPLLAESILRRCGRGGFSARWQASPHTRNRQLARATALPATWRLSGSHRSSFRLFYFLPSTLPCFGTVVENHPPAHCVPPREACRKPTTIPSVTPPALPAGHPCLTKQSAAAGGPYSWCSSG